MTMTGAESRMPLSGITDRVLAAFFDVYNELGYGFVESVYHTCLAIALQKRGLRIDQQVPLQVFFSGDVVARFKADDQYSQMTESILTAGKEKGLRDNSLQYPRFP